MFKSTFQLLAKKQLTHDVYELIYSYGTQDNKLPSDQQIIPGQYVMFQLAPGLNRAYSIASFTEENFTLIIKRIEWGRGSPMICDAPVGSSLSGLIPIGNFFLQNTQNAKCFIGTGTGFAPLYCELLWCVEKELFQHPMAFIFGVRNFRDSFYEQEILALGEKFQDFHYVEYFSREDSFESWIMNHEPQKGYVTDWITEENISKFQEFYLCGSLPMIKDAREKLEALGVEKGNIFFEPY